MAKRDYKAEYRRRKELKAERGAVFVPTSYFIAAQGERLYFYGDGTTESHNWKAMQDVPVINYWGGNNG